MLRVTCLVLSALALLAGNAFAKDHTVVVRSVTLDKATVDAGDSLKATYQVENNLPKTANPRTVRFFLTLDEDSKRGFKGVRLDNTKTPAIGADSSKTLTKGLTVPLTTASGSYLVLACISGECQATGLRVAVVGTSRLSITPTSLNFGHFYGCCDPQSEPAPFVVTNTSAARTAGPLDFSFEYSDGGGMDEGHFSIASSTCGPALAAGSSCTVNVFYDGSYGYNVTAARMSVSDPTVPRGVVFSDLSAYWDCFEPGVRVRLTPRC